LAQCLDEALVPVRGARRESLAADATEGGGLERGGLGESLLSVRWRALVGALEEARGGNGAESNGFAVERTG
jgi:hypothetical protein